MSKYDYEASRSRGQSAKLDIWNLLSIAPYSLRFGIGVYFVAIFISPESLFNPFPGCIN